MLLSKVRTSRPVSLLKTYSAWLVFSSCILILTNGFASLTLVRAYRFSVVDVMLTYGFLVFWGVIESVLLASVLVLLETLLEQTFKKNFELVFRLLVTIGLVFSLLVLFRTTLQVVIR